MLIKIVLRYLKQIKKMSQNYFQMSGKARDLFTCQPTIPMKMVSERMRMLVIANALHMSLKKIWKKGFKSVTSHNRVIKKEASVMGFLWCSKRVTEERKSVLSLKVIKFLRGSLAYSSQTP
jgi:hypothetical protein